MSQTYRAIINGNQISWLDQSPQGGEALEVYVTLAKLPAQPVTTESAQKMAAVLAQLAQLNPFRDVADPVVWQRDQRQERILPQREA